jgi:phosphatidate phosphatase PAH1
VLCHFVDILHTTYFVAAELHALVKMSRKGPEFDEEMRVRPLNPAILSGATDIIAVRHKDGTFRHSAFHVRFGWRSGVFRGGNIVDVLIDGKKTNKTMKIGSSGVAYFPDETDEDKIIRDLDATKEVFTIKFLPKITLWGRDVTKFISKFLKVEIQTQLHVWDHTDKVIISDIDGTITRSDGAGHLFFWARKWKLPILSSKNFTHAHVVDLLAAVSQRKYRIMYLTARNIGYASQVRCIVCIFPNRANSQPVMLCFQTKAYIRGIFSENNEDKRLPPGPVITSHSGLVSALWLEIFLKRPDEFKIEELRAIQSLFAPTEGLKAESPFYAGLGNRPTDTKSYIQVGKI